MKSYDLNGSKKIVQIVSDFTHVNTDETDKVDLHGLFTESASFSVFSGRLLTAEQAKYTKKYKI